MVLAGKIFGQGGILSTSRDNQTIIAMCKPIVHEFISIMIKDRYMFPYKATILLIEHMLQVIDIFYRITDTNTFPNYYHNIRYRYYLTYMLDDAFPDNIVFPTIKAIGATDLIKIRCVPILFLGVVTEPAYADQYENTPLDFWAHDIQHIRRQYQETERYYDTYIKHIHYYTKRSPFDIVSRDSFYEHMHIFTEQVLQLMNNNRDLSSIIKMIIFEIIHEKAWPITKFSICRNLFLGYDIFPIEVINFDTNDSFSITTNNFEDPTTLANLYRKLRHQFYDSSTTREYIVPKNLRTRENILKAVQIIKQGLGCNSEIDNVAINNLIMDKKNCEEFLNKNVPTGIPEDIHNTNSEQYLQTAHEANTLINKHPNSEKSSDFTKETPLQMQTNTQDGGKKLTKRKSKGGKYC